MLGKVLVEQEILTTISNHMKDNEKAGSHQCEFMHGNSCLTTLTDFYNEMNDLVDMGRAVDIIYLDMNNVFVLSLFPYNLVCFLPSECTFVLSLILRLLLKLCLLFM